uniref:Mid2 domain-containing protein n=1 Tax=Bionectria ochroleuca TaxID=29856 RepID=A0A8H7KBN3_BIOOC
MQLQPLLQGFVIKTLLLGAISARLKEQPTQASKTQHADQLVIGAYQSFSDFRQVVQNKFNSFLHRQEDVISDEHQNPHRDAPTLISTGSTDSIVKRDYPTYPVNVISYQISSILSATSSSTVEAETSLSDLGLVPISEAPSTSTIPTKSESSTSEVPKTSEPQSSSQIVPESTQKSTVESSTLSSSHSSQPSSSSEASPSTSASSEVTSVGAVNSESAASGSGSAPTEIAPNESGSTGATSTRNISSTSTPLGGPGAESESSREKSIIGIIIGVTIGGLAFGALVIAVFWFFHRRRQQQLIGPDSWEPKETPGGEDLPERSYREFFNAGLYRGHPKQGMELDSTALVEMECHRSGIKQLRGCVELEQPRRVLELDASQTVRRWKSIS